MTRLLRNLVFRFTLMIVALFLLGEAAVFGFLYWSTVALYARRETAMIDSDLADLRRRFATLDESEMSMLIAVLCRDEPGDIEQYMLAGQSYEYLAGNVARWPEGLRDTDDAVDLLVDFNGDGKIEFHRMRSTTLESGHHLLVGRNLDEFHELRTLIGRALLRTVLFTLVIGFGGGYLFSRLMARRLETVTENSRAILTGDISRRVPLHGSGDAFDRLAESLNRMFDRIESLMQSMREVTENIAHDLRKPISRMRSRIEVALMGRPDPQTYRETLERTLEESDQILKLFNALLAIALAESRASEARREPCDLTRIVQSAVELYEPAAEEAGFRLVARTDPSVTLRGDPDLLTQAVTNLIDNAIKHVPGGGEITIEARSDPHEIELSVSDRGPGIPESFRQKALERFIRLEKSRTTPGSGLGLSLVRAVATHHGGRIALSDNRPGLRVSLYFPRKTAT